MKHRRPCSAPARHITARGGDVSIAGLCREAVDRALADAGLVLADIDAVVVGKARSVRGRDDARAVPGGRARRRWQAAAAGAHRRLGGRGYRHVAASLVQAGRTAGCSRSRSRSSPSPTPCGRCRSCRRSACRCWPARAATSRRTSASYIRRSGAPGTSARWSRSRTGATAPAIRTRTSSSRTSRWSRCRPPPCCGTRSATTRPARPPTARARFIGDQAAAGPASGPVAWIRATSMRTEPTMYSGKDHVSPRAG